MVAVNMVVSNPFRRSQDPSLDEIENFQQQYYDIAKRGTKSDHDLLTQIW